jgi:hypothetical protein
MIAGLTRPTHTEDHLFEPQVKLTRLSKSLTQTMHSRPSDRSPDDLTRSDGQLRLVPVQRQSRPALTGESASGIQRTASSRPMTPKGAADFLGLDEKTITRWAWRGYLPGHPLRAGKRKHWRCFEGELSVWLAAKTNGAVADHDPLHRSCRRCRLLESQQCACKGD